MSLNNKSTRSSVIKQSSIKFPIIKIKLILLNKDVKNIESTKNIQTLINVLGPKRNISYKQRDNEFNIIVNDAQITNLYVKNVMEALFNVLKRLKSVVGFYYYTIKSKTKIFTFKCLNKKCVYNHEKVNKLMTFINE
jgi:hypothetical protein